MKNIHIFPTEKPSRLFYDISIDKLVLAPTAEVSKWFDNKHIYITSDEEIKEGEAVIHNFGMGYELEIPCDSDNLKSNTRSKIILTTDPDLIEDGVQAIDDDFIEWFVKNTSCEEVEVEKTFVTNSGLSYQEYAVLNSDFKVLEVVATIPQSSYKIGAVTKLDAYEYITDYRIIIPQEEPKYIEDKLELESRIINEVWDRDETPKQELPGIGGQTFEVKLNKDWFSKQETLEEAAARYDNISLPIPYGYVGAANDFINGAKWQKDRMYSEEDVLNFIQDIINEIETRKQNIISNAQNMTVHLLEGGCMAFESSQDVVKEKFEQFKKK